MAKPESHKVDQEVAYPDHPEAQSAGVSMVQVSVSIADQQKQGRPFEARQVAPSLRRQRLGHQRQNCKHGAYSR